MKKKVLLIGGGTGGHIIPLRNLADELLNQNCVVEIVVSDSDLDRKITDENFAGFPIHFFKTDKIRRYLSIKNIYAPFKIIKSIFSARKLLAEIKPDIIFFKGGFVGFPFLMASMLLNFRGKIYGHESDIEHGKLTKILEKTADKVFYSFGELSYPLFYSSQNPAKKITKTKPQLLIFGGSQGAQFINELIKKNITVLTKKFEILLITGVNKKIKTKKIAGFKQLEMMTASGLSQKIKESDLIISRAGANSLFEIVSAKKPSLIIPLPSAAKNHQEKNAQFFAKKGLCYVFNQEKNHDFLKILEACFKDKDLKSSLEKSTIQNSAKLIVDEIIASK